MKSNVMCCFASLMIGLLGLLGLSAVAEIVVSYDDKEVHHVPLIAPFPPPTNTYWRMVLKVEKKEAK